MDITLNHEFNGLACNTISVGPNPLFIKLTLIFACELNQQLLQINKIYLFC